MNPSSNLFLIGPMGAGKTTLGRGLAASFGLCFVDLDEEIERVAGTGIPSIFAREGEAGFRARERRQLAACSAREGIVLACGGGVVLAAANRACLTARGFVVHLDVTVAEQLRRLRGDSARPLLAAPDRRARLEALARERNPLYAAAADLVIACGRASPAGSHAVVLERLRGAWQRLPQSAVSP